MKLRLESYIKFFMSLWQEFVGIVNVFLLFVVGEKDPIGFSWLLCWYLLRYCGYYYRRFSVLSHFVFVNRFLFYRRTVVVRSG